MNNLSNHKNNEAMNILYSEDFNSVLPVIIDTPEENVDIDSEKLIENIITEDDLKKAYEKGVIEGRELEKKIFERDKNEWEIFIKEEISNFIVSFEKEKSEACQKYAKEISEVILKSLISMFPSKMEKFGNSESEEIIKIIVPEIKKNINVRIFSSEELIEISKKYFSDNGRVGMEFILDPSYESGDFKIEWETGSMSRDVNAVTKKIMDHFSIS